MVPDFVILSKSGAITVDFASLKVICKGEEVKFSNLKDLNFRGVKLLPREIYGRKSKFRISGNFPQNSKRGHFLPLKTYLVAVIHQGY